MPRARGAASIVLRCAAGTLVFLLAASAATTQQRHTPWTDAQPLMAALGDAVPATLRASGLRESDWSAWVDARDREIRSRLAEGDEDTVLNWLLLGTSFTSDPPVVLDASLVSDERGLREMAGRIAARLSALLSAAASPGTDTRRLFVRDLLRRQGFDVATEAGRDAAREYLLGRLGPFINDWTQRAAQPGVHFEERGLSLDTSLQPNFAIDAALAEVKARGLLTAGSVRRVGIIGAGLDFADKNSGFDFYPPQTVQPFAVIESLGRLGLSSRETAVSVVALDISPRVLDHIGAAARQPATGTGYVINLPLDSRRPWLPAFREYWQGFGRRVGTEEARAGLGAPAGVEMRSVRLPARVARQLATADVNAVTDRWQGVPFDLVIATNVLVYYGPFEQALALSNVAAGMTGRGIFLSNTALPDVGVSPVRRLGSTQVAFTSDGVGDEVIWYGRSR